MHHLHSWLMNKYVNVMSWWSWSHELLDYLQVFKNLCIIILQEEGEEEEEIYCRQIMWAQKTTSFSFQTKESHLSFEELNHSTPHEITMMMSPITIITIIYIKRIDGSNLHQASLFTLFLFLSMCISECNSPPFQMVILPSDAACDMQTDWDRVNANWLRLRISDPHRI